jgi:hypothetical protein
MEEFILGDLCSTSKDEKKVKGVAQSNYKRLLVYVCLEENPGFRARLKELQQREHPGRFYGSRVDLVNDPLIRNIVAVFGIVVLSLVGGKALPCANGLCH